MRKARGKNFGGMASLRAAQCTYVIDKVTRVKSLKQNNMPIFVISSQFIYYIVIFQILSNLFLDGKNVSDTVLTVITNNKKMVGSLFLGVAMPPRPRSTTDCIIKVVSQNLNHTKVNYRILFSNAWVILSSLRM